MTDLLKQLLIKKDEDCFYNNKITGTCFDVNFKTGSCFDTQIDGDELEVAVKGSNDWRDWIRNTIQLFGIIGSIYLIKNGYYIGFLTLFISCTVHLGFLLGGLEVFIQLVKLRFWNYKQIRGCGYSLGGTIIQWVAIFVIAFGQGNKFQAITVGSPKILSVLSPLFWILYLFKIKINVVNYINPLDKVPKTPPVIFGFIKHIGKTEKVIEFGKTVIGRHDLSTYYEAVRHEQD